jgi:predicted  nucleic acid-binding Zn-ribbon protein
MLFKRIVLKYKSDIRMINVRIDNAQKALALAAASDMEALRETYEEHLTEIQEMQLQLEANNPKMTTMIESYRRGFLKGIAANAVNFINNK